MALGRTLCSQALLDSKSKRDRCTMCICFHICAPLSSFPSPLLMSFESVCSVMFSPFQTEAVGISLSTGKEKWMSLSCICYLFSLLLRGKQLGGGETYSLSLILLPWQINCFQKLDVYFTHELRGKHQRLICPYTVHACGLLNIIHYSPLISSGRSADCNASERRGRARVQRQNGFPSAASPTNNLLNPAAAFHSFQFIRHVASLIT